LGKGTPAFWALDEFTGFVWAASCFGLLGGVKTGNGTSFWLSLELQNYVSRIAERGHMYNIV